MHVSGRTNLIWPQTTFYDITLDAGKHIYAQIAPEPNYRWKEYCSQSLAIADELDVNRIITLGSMFSDCPHTRPLPIAVSDGDCQCEGDRSYNGPVGIPTVLDVAAAQQGFAHSSMWVSIPPIFGQRRMFCRHYAIAGCVGQAYRLHLRYGISEAESRTVKRKLDTGSLQ